MELVALARLVEATGPAFPLRILTASAYIFEHLAPRAPRFHRDREHLITGARGPNDDLIHRVQSEMSERLVLLERARDHSLVTAAVELARAAALRAEIVAAGAPSLQPRAGPIVYRHVSTGIFHVVNQATGRCFCGLVLWPGVEGVHRDLLTAPELVSSDLYACERCRRSYRAAVGVAE